MLFCFFSLKMSRDSSKHVANLNIYKNVYMLCSNWFMKTKVPLPNFYYRIIFDLIQIYKIIYDLSDIKFCSFFVFKSNSYNLRGNTKKIQLKSDFQNSKVMQVQNCFFYRVTKYWNLLPNEIALCPSLNLFKRYLSDLDLTNF